MTCVRIAFSLLGLCAIDGFYCVCVRAQTGSVAGRPRQYHLLPAAMILSIASLTVKLAALARGGNSLKLSRYCATTAWAGTSKNARCACQSPYNILLGPRSNGSDLTLYSIGARSFRKLPCQTPSGVLGPTSTCCSMNETFQLRTRSAMRSPSSLQ